ncbi:MAG: response regulator, partial [Deferribacteraceae bacterium]|nr:response regulator [Deferribacteraceae bacterium]
MKMPRKTHFKIYSIKSLVVFSIALFLIAFVIDGHSVTLIIVATILIIFNLIIASVMRSLNRNIQSLKVASKTKSDFLAKMSHEIRTPMNAIIGMAEIALREPVPSREHLFTIKQAGANLLSIINDILDFSKIEAGKMEIVNGDYLMASLVNDVISIIRMRTIDSQVYFVVNIDCNIPSVLYGDEIRIRQILLNLLSNAVKFTKEGYVSLSILAENDEEDSSKTTLSMSVADTGMGIKPEDIDKLFKEFTRVELEQNKNVVGTGLGLAITRSLIKMMGGEITLDSEYGAGSTFTVKLPQTIRSEETLAFVEKPEEKQVLVYELRPSYADSIICTIDNLGVECTLVLSADELQKEMETGNYAYVFIATNLYEGVRKLKFGSEIKIVLLAGFGENIANSGLSILAMPVHSISVANILNGESNSFVYNESSEPITRFIAPEAKILVVDDIDTNLIVAKGLLMPYEMQLTFCNSGADALEAVKHKKFDLIFMDHMMPEMDGIEALTYIKQNADNRDIPIIALTANAVSGAKEMFMEARFHDFLSKPIDVLKLNNMLEKWLPKAKQIRHIKKVEAAAIDPKLMEVFRRDAEKAAITLRQTIDNGDIKLFTITAHAMKSALGNVGEREKAELAFALEKAGQVT